MGSVRIDPFFYKQPSLSFVEELRSPLHISKPEWFECRELKEGEISTLGAFLQNLFVDSEGLLKTATDDFERFLGIYEISGKQYPIILKKSDTPCYEAYRICITEANCQVEANDTEGIRRALVYLEDEMLRRGGPILPLGTISRQPFVRTRITRGFFSPTNRPPKCIDELMDDIDYYPDEYLNRLAHDGTNGIWIYTRFKDLLPSEIFPEYGQYWERRIEKLRKVVAKCKRYGIKVYVFGVEPAALTPEMAEKYPEIVGYYTSDDNYTLCTYTEQGAAYCIETTRKLLELVPDLGGIIDISDGERMTSCSSAAHHELCPRCSRFSKGQVLAHTLDLLQEGIRRSGTNAEFISWTYGHRDWNMTDIQDYINAAPGDVMLMENFDDAGYSEQLGKTRQAIDYWLSYVGPSQMFEGAARKALEANKRMFAKMQVCCSHELATVPYIPVPGILFDKYAGARAYRTEGVMQCWYFGNYPSMMSKAAGELSFMEDFSDKNAFLNHLAGIYYGNFAAEAVKAWQCFEEGYQNCPINIMFSYYGPMHDGVVWELALQPRNTSLPRTWQLLDAPDGDRIGECLQNGHTLDEAVQLTKMMRDCWQEGMARLPQNTPSEQRSVAACLQLLLASGHNILKYYQMRYQLLKQTSNSKYILDEMMSIVEEEVQNSKKMIPLCDMDPRLGYHSEAEGYKFFPEKLHDRIDKLITLKEVEFPAAYDRIANGDSPISWHPKENDIVYILEKNLERAPWERLTEEASFRAAVDEYNLVIELHGKQNTMFKLYFEFEPMWPAPGICIKDTNIHLVECALTHQSVFGDKIQKELDKYRLTVGENGDVVLSISRKAVQWTDDCPIRMFISADGESWVKDDDPVHTLGKEDASPMEYGWLVPRFEEEKNGYYSS